MIFLILTRPLRNSRVWIELQLQFEHFEYLASLHRFQIEQFQWELPRASFTFLFQFLLSNRSPIFGRLERASWTKRLVSFKLDSTKSFGAKLFNQNLGNSPLQTLNFKDTLPEFSQSVLPSALNLKIYIIRIQRRKHKNWWIKFE